MFNKFRTKVVTVEAFRLSRENCADARTLLGRNAYDDSRDAFDPLNMMLRNKHGNVLAKIGDWIVKERDGSGFYPVEDPDFRAKYEMLPSEPKRG